MGSQRRLEETCRIIDKLDSFAYEQDSIAYERALEAGEKTDKGRERLWAVTCHVEPSRVEEGAKVYFVRATYNAPATDPAPTDESTPPRVHFYEGYWAPITGEVVPAREVFFWLLKRLKNPISVLIYSSWRSRARLRRATLRELWPPTLGEQCRRRESLRFLACLRHLPKRLKSRTAYDEAVNKALLPLLGPKQIRTLLSVYDLFESLEARRFSHDGEYKGFRAFLDKQLARSRLRSDAERLELLRAADCWHRAAIWSEIRNLFVLVTLFLLITLVSLILVLVLRSLLVTLSSLPLAAWLAELTQPTMNHILSLSGVVLLIVGLRGFLTGAVGDVVYWCTYEETDTRNKKRREILDYGVGVLQHVLKDSLCRRVVILSHSLGTAITHDVLLELGKDDWARTHNIAGLEGLTTKQLNKIEHFVTMGSPIDKIHYFFESDPQSSHRFTRVSETVRGDMGRKPFGNNNNRPFLHWINFWDKADIISGSLESPPNATDVDVFVDNVEVSNGRIPNPNSAHRNYFENKYIIRILFDIIFNNQYSYRSIDRHAPSGPRDYSSMNLRPGSGRRETRILQIIALLVPWVVLGLFAALLVPWVDLGLFAKSLIQFLVRTG